MMHNIPNDIAGNLFNLSSAALMELAAYANSCIMQVMQSLGLPITPDNAKELIISYYPYEFKNTDGEWRLIQEFEISHDKSGTRELFRFEAVLGKEITE